MLLEFRRLVEVEPADIIALMNDPRVRRHMPLARGEFGPAECASFVDAKEAFWREHGYGPHAFYLGGEFAGWGGIQPENGDADLALVLRPEFWGHGRRIYEAVLDRAFGELGLDSVVVRLPPSRGRAHALARLGFQADGEEDVFGAEFMRYRLRPNRP